MTIKKSARDTTAVDYGRRQALKKLVLGAGMLGLRSLASGIPTAILANPRRALAANPTTCVVTNPQYLIFSTSSDGDPVNANVPGTYLDPNIMHSEDPAMEPTQVMMSGQQSVAARPWSTLPQNVLDRTCFFHHATMTAIHPDERNVLSLMGAANSNEMLVSIISNAMAPCLGTIQVEPISVASQTPAEALLYQGRPQPQLTPTGLASMLTTPSGPLAQLQQMRDSDLNSLNAWFKSQGNSGAKDFIDRYATSQVQARNIAQNLLQSLSSISDNGPNGQILAASILIQMKVTPVVSIHIPFGQDNHSDPDLQTETAEHITGVGYIDHVMQTLASAGIQNSTTFGMMNVFGRTLGQGQVGRNGREHSGNHHATLMIGSNVRGGVVGGIAPTPYGDFTALGIDSASGAGNAGGDIPFNQTLAAAGKTLGRAVGVTDAQMSAAINGGKAVLSALVQ